MEAMIWENSCLKLLDQTQLPKRVVYLWCEKYSDVIDAVKRLSVRGAPAIGAAAAYGLVLGAQSAEENDLSVFKSKVNEIADELAAARPTAVNLMWAMERMQSCLHSSRAANKDEIVSELLEEAHCILRENMQGDRQLGEYGTRFIKKGARILTHCNAGALATAGYGTALGVVRAARENDLEISVYASETRPLLQGARLTTWEMMQEGIPVTLITDNVAGYLMARGMVDLVIVGADRIAANGDTANKIGTYGLAVLAREHEIPFYVAAPVSTIDYKTVSGESIPIEEREWNEVTSVRDAVIAPEGVQVWNPAFDITPANLISAIITEKGIAQPVSKEALQFK
ncbi:MAG: S-methyl-5-thioribose-1-phosphate isomerase [Clostridiales bacterium]|nr:S-methyl-5-thioribose-1-phosphate isomerase [Clostridiales bacterium]MCF8022599.1 S-methyl-5-thioribose-1-phosphate isomerase [Clostridiales bacterium]